MRSDFSINYLVLDKVEVRTGSKSTSVHVLLLIVVLYLVLLVTG